MRLYLSSYRLGNHIDQLYTLAPKGSRIAIIQNAVDHLPQSEREQYYLDVYDINAVFEELGYQPESLDLRKYFDKQQELEIHLRQFDIIWVCGGNTFILRRAMQRSGFDKIITGFIQNDEVVYGGWSAGICVLAPSLKGLELCDQPNEIPSGYNTDVIWNGLGILDYSLAPHYRSGHFESEMVEDVVKYFDDQGMPHQKLTDGDVIVYNGTEPQLFKKDDGLINKLNLNKADR